MVEDKLFHSYGRMFFWTHKYIVTQEHNGDLAKAFEQLQEAKQRKKELDREIIASAHNEESR